MSDLPKSPNARAVFVSYSREDTPAAQRIAEALRSHGVEVWFDQNELRGGDAWDQKIRRQINDCTLFLPVISAHTQARSKGYFRLEWKLAVEQTHLMLEGVPFLAPVVIDDTSESGAAVPAEFMRVQWTRLPGALPTTQFVEQVKRLLATAAAPVPAVTHTRLPIAMAKPIREEISASEKSRGFPGWAWAAVAVVVIIVAVFFVTRKSETPSPAMPPSPVAETKPARPALDPHRIAVMPLDNFSPDTKDEYLSGGMTEELTSSLSKISGLEVIARTSSERMKKSGQSLSEIGSELRAGTVLEGSVRKAGEQLRISVELIDVASERHLWAQEYDTEFKDIFKMQSDIAERGAAALKIQLLAADKNLLAQKSTENPEAHRLYLLGRFHMAKITTEGWSTAKRYFEEAIQADPTYALAYCGLADVYGFQQGTILGKDAWTKEKELAQKALTLAPDSADAHLSLGIARWSLFEWRAGEVEVKRALELNPNLALAYDQYAWFQAISGRFDQPISLGKRAVELDPLSPLMASDYSWWFYHARRFDEAMALARKTLEFDPNIPYPHVLLGWALLWKKETAAALAEFQKAKALDENPARDGNLGYFYAVTGERGKAEKILISLDDLEQRQHLYISPGVRACICLGLGENSKALDWLDKCYEDIDQTCWNLKVDPIYDPIRADPRFQALLKKVGFEK